MSIDIKYDKLMSFSGAEGDINIITMREFIESAKESAQLIYSKACGKWTIIDDWEEDTKCFRVNYEDLQALEDCDLLRSLIKDGYVVIID